jgi:hypothetical protein
VANTQVPPFDLKIQNKNVLNGKTAIPIIMVCSKYSLKKKVVLNALVKQSFQFSKIQRHSLSVQ